jgi:hypothetical protein
MQMLYLLPPAFLGWRSFESGSASVVLLVRAGHGGPGSLPGARLARHFRRGRTGPDMACRVQALHRRGRENSPSRPYDSGMTVVDRPTISGLPLLSLMLSQAMESVTRAIYTSPTSISCFRPRRRRRRSSRCGSLPSRCARRWRLYRRSLHQAAEGGAHWLRAYGAVAAMGAAAAAVAVGLTTRRSAPSARGGRGWSPRSSRP